MSAGVSKSLTGSAARAPEARRQGRLVLPAALQPRVQPHRAGLAGSTHRCHSEPPAGRHRRPHAGGQEVPRELRRPWGPTGGTASRRSLTVRPQNHDPAFRAPPLLVALVLARDCPFPERSHRARFPSPGCHRQNAQSARRWCRLARRGPARLANAPRRYVGKTLRPGPGHSRHPRAPSSP